MNRLLKLSLLSLCLTGPSLGATPAPMATAPVGSPELALQEKRAQRKTERAHQLLDLNLKEYTELETRIAAEKDIKRQKKATAARKHAEIELGLAQDPEFADEMLWHVRQTKRYLQRVKNVLEGKEEQNRERRKRMAEMRAQKEEMASQDKTPKAS